MLKICLNFSLISLGSLGISRIFYLFLIALSAFQACDSDSVTSEITEQDSADLALPQPIEGCVGPQNIMAFNSDQESTNLNECMTCIGAETPNFKLRDMNPTSCGVGQYYGLDAFRGEITFVVLLRSTCSYCQAQLEKLEQMRFEFLAMEQTVHMVVINEIGTETQIENLTQRAQFPIFQDQPEVKAWASLSSVDSSVNEPQRIGGDKDDMYIYDRQGQLWRFLDDDDPSHQLNLSTDEGYAYLKEAISTALTEAP